MIERAMRSLHFAVDSKRSAKQQALDLIPQLQQAIPLERAPMRLRITLSGGGDDNKARDTQLGAILDRVQVGDGGAKSNAMMNS